MEHKHVRRPRCARWGLRVLHPSLHGICRPPVLSGVGQPSLSDGRCGGDRQSYTNSPVITDGTPELALLWSDAGPE